ncbi:MAG TPA: efflux RND transporter periplasmic adaptor subunit [Acidimicrobiales bacterium]
MPKSTRTGWGRAGHRRAVLIGVVVLAIVLGGGVAAWAAVSGGDTQYRMADVTRADIGTSLTVVGDVAPVNEATASFQVGGKVATVTVAPGQQVTAGQTLGTLDTTALSEDVSSAESTLSADEAKLVEDEENQASAASSSSNNNSSSNKPQGSSSPSTTTTTTTAPTRNGSGSGSGSVSGSGSGSGGPNPTVTADQTTLTQDQSTLSTDQQKEAADLTQAQSDCTSAKTGTTTGQAICEAALQTVSADETQVSKDEGQVSKDEAALAQALTAESSGGGGSGGGGSSPTQSGHAESNAQNGVTGNSGAGTGNGATGSSSGGNGNTSSGGGSSSGTGGSTGSAGSATTNTDTPEQIASDQAAIDSAQANLTEAQQALNGATLSSPISGTVVSVGINVGDTVSANSSTEVISIIGTKSYEVQATLDSTQVPSVKVGQSATVSVDGVGGTMGGTVSQVGPVQSTSSGYSYPVVIALPSSATGLYPGSTANVVISTGEVNNVVAVPTSAVQSLGSRAYVLELDKGTLTRKVITIGMVGDVYTQVDSGLTPGQSVVLADYAEAVPSSNTNTVGGLGNFLGGGAGAGGLFGGGGGFFRGGGGQFQVNIGTAKG